jgi:HAD superfamily hydrolase (TIGR01509 family)
MFDEFLAGRGERPFDEVRDYDEYVDGRPRLDGVRAFLASRGIELGDDEVERLGNRKNDIVRRMFREDGVDAYPGSVRYVEAAREAGLRRAVVSSSANTVEILASAGISELFDAVVDGNVRQREGLRGKPAPDTFLYAARGLGLEAAQAAVFEDALAGVAAGRAGGFFVVGVDRVGQAEELREHGADVVVSDLAELLA